MMRGCDFHNNEIMGQNNEIDDNYSKAIFGDTA